MGCIFVLSIFSTHKAVEFQKKSSRYITGKSLSNKQSCLLICGSCVNISKVERYYM